MSGSHCQGRIDCLLLESAGLSVCVYLAPVACNPGASRFNTRTKSTKVAPGFRNDQCADQVDQVDRHRKYRKRRRDLRRAGACERDEGRHHATQGEADVPG
jgi:hypothetical protein